MREEDNKMNLKIVISIKEAEFVFSDLDEYEACANFIDKWVAFVRDSRANELEPSGLVYWVKLCGKVYGDSRFDDGDEIETSPIVKIEKIKRSKPSMMDCFYSFTCWWKRIRQSYRFTTEDGRVYIVPLPTLAKQTFKLMDAAYYGAGDEMEFKVDIF